MGVIVGCITALFAGLSQVPEESVEILRQIRAYEDLFMTVQVEYTIQSCRARDDGSLEAQGAPMNCVYYSDADRKRHDSMRTDANSGVLEVRRRVSDGETEVDWHVSDVDSKGQAVIQPVPKNMPHMFPVELLQPFYWRTERRDDTHDFEVVTVGDESVTVHLNHVRTPRWRHFYEMKYQRFGDYLRPVEICLHSFPEGRPPSQSIQNRYHYGQDEAGGECLYPLRIEQISEVHDVHTVQTLTRVDFAPNFPDDLFELSLEEGTWVIDKAAGITRRNYRAGVSTARLARNLMEDVDQQIVTSLTLAESREEDVEKAVVAIEESRQRVASNSRASLGYAVAVAVAGSAVGLTIFSLYRRRSR